MKRDDHENEDRPEEGETIYEGEEHASNAHDGHDEKTWCEVHTARAILLCYQDVK